MKRLSLLQVIFIVLTIIFFTACSKSGSNPTPKGNTTILAINSIDINAGPYNTRVIITGTGFSPTVANDQVFFNGKLAEIEFVTPTKIYADVPLGAGTGNITITVDGSNVTGPVFTYQPALVVINFAGNPFQPGFANGTGDAAKFSQPLSLAIDKNDNLYVADSYNLRIRKITPQKVVSTFAGSGKQGHADGPASDASFDGITGIAVDPVGNVFVADGGLIRKITTDGNVSTITTHLNLGNILLGRALAVTGITVDAADNLYITDRGAQFIGKVTPDGTVTAIAGIQPTSPNGTIIPTIFTSPNSIVLDKNGNLFITDGIVWKIALPNTISKYAISGPNGQGFSGPQGIATDSQGNVYITDTGNVAIKKITSDGTVSTFAGIPDTAVPTNGSVNKASFVFPYGIAVDKSGNVFVTDGNAIREITFQ